MNKCTCIQGCYDPFCTFDEATWAKTQAEGYKELGIALDCLDAAIRLEEGAQE